MTKMVMIFIVLFPSFTINFDPREEHVAEVYSENEYEKF